MSIPPRHGHLTGTILRRSGTQAKLPAGYKVGSAEDDSHHRDTLFENLVHGSFVMLFICTVAERAGF